MPRWMNFVFVLLVMTLFAACGDDTQKKGGNNGTDELECPAGQRYNPILDKCEDTPVFNNGTSNNDGNNQTANNGSGNNQTANNGAGNNVTNNATSNNGGTNNGASNNDTNNHTVPPLECGLGSLKGKTCAPSGEPLAAADVTVTGVDCDGNPFEMTARTATDGTFEITDIPSGNHDLKVSTGSFESTRMVIIQKDQVTDLTSAAEKVCLDQNVEIAVITGAYDHVEGVLDDLNLDYTVVGGDGLGDTSSSGTFLSNPATMAQYDLIFINCGGLDATIDFFANRQTIYNNLRTYVQGGGSLYVADWSHPFLEGAFPDMVDFYGSESNVNQNRNGYAPQTITADVLTPDLQALLGANTATIEFPHDGSTVINNNWVVAEGVGASSVAQLSGDAKLCGAFQSSDCSSVTGTQEDSPLLVTYKDASGGTVIFTTFHNERQSALNQDMELILRFLIFQL